jgi:hypothetical protein
LELTHFILHCPVTEFVKNIEDSLEVNLLETQLDQLNSKVDNNEIKIQKLVDMNLEGKIDSDILNKKIDQINIEQNQLIEQKKIVTESLESDKSISMRINSFKKTINESDLMDEFDRLLMEAIIEGVVVGQEDQNGEAIPKVLTFILKSGLEISEEAINNVKKNMDGIVDPETYSHTGYNHEETCSHEGYLPL